MKLQTSSRRFSFEPLVRRCGAAILLCWIVVSSFLCASSQAVLIDGKIDFGGVVTYDTTSLATATRVNLWNSSIVLQRTGDFANPTYSIDPNDPAMMTAPWIFNPSTPTNALWSIGGFTFDLSSSVVASQSAQFLDVTGTGTITGNGFDPTPGLWSFTSSKSDGGTSSTFGFQAQASAVPEPASIIFLGLGLTGILGAKWLRRRRE